MNEKKVDPAIQPGIKFDPVEENHLIKGGTLRSEASVTVKPTGSAKTNTEMKEMIIRLLESLATAAAAAAAASGAEAEPFNLEKFRLRAGVNSEVGAIALYAADWGTKGAMPARVWANAIGFHLGATFRKYPSLRPNTTVECAATRTKDAEGRDCIVFNILSALPKAKTRRKSSSSGDTAESK